MKVRKAMRRSVPIVLFGAAATVMLRKRLLPRPALPPGVPTPPETSPVEDAIAEHCAAIVATATDAPQSPAPVVPDSSTPDRLHTAVSATTPAETGSESRESGFQQRLRRAPVDIVRVVDDLLGAAR